MSEQDTQPPENIDRLGAIASSICAVHCALCGLLPAAFTVLGLGFLLGHEAEWLLTIVAVSFAAGALAFSWRRHRSVPVALLLSLGIVGLLASRGLEMGSDHPEDDQHADGSHDETGAEHADATPADKQNSESKHSEDAHHEEGDAHHGEGDAHHEDAHAHDSHGFGASVGVVGGLFLVAGHLLNIRTLRRRRDETCPC